MICKLDGMPHKSMVLLWVVKGDRGEKPYDNLHAAWR